MAAAAAQIVVDLDHGKASPFKWKTMVTFIIIGAGEKSRAPLPGDRNGQIRRFVSKKGINPVDFTEMEHLPTSFLLCGAVIYYIIKP